MLNLRFFLTIVLVLYFHTISIAQCNSIKKIVNSNISLLEKQKKIDILVKSFNINNDPCIVDCYYYLSSKWYYANWTENFEKQDINNAIKYNTLAIRAQEQSNLLDINTLIKGKYNLARFLAKNNQLFKAKKIYQDLITKYPESNIFLQAKNKLGLINIDIGDYEQALKHFDEIMSILSTDKHNWQLILYSYLNALECFQYVGFTNNTEKAKKYFHKTKEIIQKYNLQATFDFCAQEVLNGNFLIERKKYSEAITIYKNILTNNCKDNELHKLGYNNIGFCQLKIGDTLNAKNNFSKSIEIDQKYSSPYNNLGDISLGKKQFIDALKLYQKAIDLELSISPPKASKIYSLPTTEQLEVVLDKSYLLEHITTKAKGWLAYYEHTKDKKHLVEALKTFKLADQLIDIIRRENIAYQSKLFWRKQSAELYMNAVKACYYLNDTKEAFYFMERNKSLLLLEDISNEKAKKISNLPDTIAAREFQLKQAIFLAQNELQSTHHTAIDSLQTIKQRIYTNKIVHKRFLDSIAKKYPKYVSLKRKPKILPFENFKSNYVFKNEGILHYILNDKDGYGLLHTTDRSIVFKLENVETINQNIIQLNDLLKKRTSETKQLHQLSNTIFENILPKEVFQLIKGKKLTIVADYSLQKIPFETLVTDITTNKYFIEDVEVSYVNSISFLYANSTKKSIETKRFLGVAPFEFNDSNLNTLIHSKNEITQINKMYPGDVLLDTLAKKEALISKLGKYSIVHLSTHADIDATGNHWIAFRNQKMYINEIYAQKNQADMLVLSACNTTSGEIKQGEGVMSLARGFFYGGAKSVVASLWPVHDSTTKDLMIDFCVELKKGNTKSTALRQAKLKSRYFER